MLWPKKNSYKEFDNEKKFLLLENSPPPPITFLMVRPLREHGSSETKNWTRGSENLGVAILKQTTNVVIQIARKKLKLIAVSNTIWRCFSCLDYPAKRYLYG